MAWRGLWWLAGKKKWTAKRCKKTWLRRNEMRRPAARAFVAGNGLSSKGCILAAWRLGFSRGDRGTSMPERFDIVVVGAGHNSLITAAYLAKAGDRCLILVGGRV